MIYIRILAVALTILLIGCKLPTSPEGARSSVAPSSSVTASGNLMPRRRATDPLGHRLSPPCSAPAPLRSALPQERVSGYIFVYRDGTDSKTVTAELAAKYDFSPEFVYTIFPGFAANVTEQALASIRCDPRVKQVEYDVSVTLAGG